MRLIVSILLSPWSQTKTSIHQTSSMFCREATSDQNYQARLNRLDLTAYKILDIGNRDIAISFLSDIHFRNICCWINQYPYRYLALIVIPFPVLAKQWICLWSYHHFYIHWRLWSLMNQGEYPSTFEFFRPRHLLLWLDSYMMQLSRYEEKTKQKWWTSSPRRRVILSEWYQYDNFSRVNEGPDFLGGFELDKPGGVMNAASPLRNANEWEAKHTR